VTFVVVTTVKVEEGSIDELAALFDATNRDLVAGHDDWLGAWFTANRETSEVTVVARWTDPDSYDRLRNSDEFQATMARFAERFAGPPDVSINEILVEM
jgi:quinol monooxygenase YgiN